MEYLQHDEACGLLHAKLGLLTLAIAGQRLVVSHPSETCRSTDPKKISVKMGRSKKISVFPSTETILGRAF